MNKTPLENALDAIKTLESEVERLRGEVERLRAEQSLMQDDLAALLRALDLGDHARPESPHEVMLSAIAAVERLWAQPSVAICKEERDEGNGGCGACALCCKEHRERAEQAEAGLARVMGKLHEMVAAARRVVNCAYEDKPEEWAEAVFALEATLAAAQPEEHHPFEPCLEDENTPGHNFTCALLCLVCGLPREKHAAARPEEGSRG